MKLKGYLLFSPFLLSQFDWQVYLNYGVPNLSILLVTLILLPLKISNKYFSRITLILLCSFFYILNSKSSSKLDFLKTFLNYSIILLYANIIFKYLLSIGKNDIERFITRIIRIIILLTSFFIIIGLEEIIFTRSYLIENVPRLRFLFLEPSHLGMFLGILFYFSYTISYNSKQLSWLFILGVLAQSPSFVILVATTIFLNSKRLKLFPMSYYFAVLPIAAFGIYQAAIRVLNTLNGVDSGGGIARLNSTLASIKLFVDHGYKGLGVGQNHLYYQNYYNDNWKILEFVKTNGDNALLTIANELGLIFFIIIVMYLKKLIPGKYLLFIAIYLSLGGSLTDSRISLLIGLGFYLKYLINNEEKDLSYSPTP